MTRSYWRVSSDTLGEGGLHEMRADAEQELEEMRLNDPEDTVTLVEERMTMRHYESLPEFPGW